MADVVDRIRKELQARIERLRPLVAAFERLQRAAAALARGGARAAPGHGSRWYAARQTSSHPDDRSRVANSAR